MLKIRYEYFWNGLNPETFFITEYISSSYKIVYDDSYDIIVMSVFYQNSSILNIKKDSLKILFNGENPLRINLFIQHTQIYPDIVIGFITEPIPNIIQLYYPLWILYMDKYSDEYFLQKNNNVKSCNKDYILSLKKCCLINSHDNTGIRTPIYNIVSTFFRVDCPGIALNNMDRRLLGPSGEDKITFMKDYLFNICAENSYGKGYLTEKMPQCLESNCIPIYFGDISEFNAKIFNLNRVIHIKDISKLDNLNLVIESLVKDDNKLYSLYNEPIFNQESYKYIKNLKIITKNLLQKILLKIK
jgi:hypothetical protein